LANYAVCLSGTRSGLYLLLISSEIHGLNVVERAPLTLHPGATLSFTFRVRLVAATRQPLAVHAGRTGLLVTVVRHSPFGSGATLATVRLGVPVAAG
jgi:hypothetical protein